MDMNVHPLLLKSPLTEEEVLEILNIDIGQLVKLRLEGKISRYKTGNKYEYMASNVKRYLKEAEENGELE